jgi:hypothetical protein
LACKATTADLPSIKQLFEDGMAIEAVIWDFGGVFTTSPFEAFLRYEAERGLPSDFIRMVNATDPDTNAWARFERSEIHAADLRHDVPGGGHAPGPRPCAGPTCCPCSMATCGRGCWRR